MTERTESNRLVRMSPRLYSLLMVFMLIGALGGFTYRGHVDYRDIIDSNQRVLKFRSENNNLKSQNADQDGRLAALQDKLKSAQDALDALIPAENTYNFNPNQSLIVAGGRLTVGLVGPPGNEGVNINVNDKQYSASAGSVINITLDSSTTCHVGVESFDAFRAILTASCAEPKPQ